MFYVRCCEVDVWRAVARSSEQCVCACQDVATIISLTICTESRGCSSLSVVALSDVVSMFFKKDLFSLSKSSKDVVSRRDGAFRCLVGGEEYSEKFCGLPKSIPD